MFAVALSILSTVLTSGLGAFLLLRRRKITALQDLCSLRKNSMAYYRAELTSQTHAYKTLMGKYTTMTQGMQIFLRQYNALTREFGRLRTQAAQAPRHEDLAQMRTVNEDLTYEFAKVLQRNHEFEEQICELRAHYEDVEQIAIEKFELRQQLIRLENANRQLSERNEELEYAINLESISMLETYQEQNKLFGAIDDVRRSLTRILNPA